MKEEDALRPSFGTQPKVRGEIAKQVVEGIKIPLAEAARALGVATSAISKVLRRRGGE